MPPCRALLLLLVLIALHAMHSDAICGDDRPPDLPEEEAAAEAEAKKHPQSAKFEAAAIRKTIAGVCYSPFHNKEYPLHGGSAAGLDRAMYDDFRIMKTYFSVVRTYYSSYFGYAVTPQAAAHGVKLHLGVFMTNEGWYAAQVNAAIDAVKNYPNTVVAILVGNENITPVGPYSPQDVSNRISELRARLKSETGRTVPIGTVQRATEWVDSSRTAAFQALANNCDIIGVNIYPFFDSNYDPNLPLVILNAVWNKMTSLYPAAKVRLTEIGYPTGGSAPSYAPKNTPSLANARKFYAQFINWNPAAGGGEAFWFMFFDRAPQDNTMLVELEKYFGFYTWDKKSKAGDYPVFLSMLGQSVEDTAPTTAQPTTTPPTTNPPTNSPPTTTPPTTTDPPKTTTPTPTTTAPAIVTIPPSSLSSNVCRVRKTFYGA